MTTSRSRLGNTFWEEEKTNKGLGLMAKMGWSQGQGLGKHEQGGTTHLRVKVKNNTEGIGATAATADDMFRSSQNVFNDILLKLNKKAKGDAVDEPKDEVPSYECENTATTFKRYSARTEMYRKFKRGKDINNYSATAMQEIMGKSTGESSGATITYAPSYPSASAGAAGASSSSSSSVAPVKAEPQQAELVTVKSSQSIQDYFKNKMAAAAAAQKPASRFQVASGAGFSEDFQADYAESMKASAYSGRIGLGFGSHAATPFSGSLSSGGLGFAPAKSATAAPAAPSRTQFDDDDDDAPSTVPKLEAADSDSETAAAAAAKSGKSSKSSVKTEAADDDDESDEARRQRRKAKKALKRQAEAEAEAEAAAAAAAAIAASATETKEERRARKQQQKEREAAEAAAADELAATEAAQAAKAEKKARKREARELEEAAAAEAAAEEEAKAEKKAKKAKK